MYILVELERVEEDWDAHTGEIRIFREPQRFVHISRPRFASRHAFCLACYPCNLLDTFAEKIPTFCLLSETVAYTVMRNLWGTSKESSDQYSAQTTINKNKQLKSVSF